MGITYVEHSEPGCGAFDVMCVGSQASWGCGTVITVGVVIGIMKSVAQASQRGVVANHRGVWHRCPDRSSLLNISTHSGGCGTVQAAGPRSRVQHSWWKGIHPGVRGCGRGGLYLEHSLYESHLSIITCFASLCVEHLHHQDRPRGNSGS